MLWPGAVLPFGSRLPTSRGCPWISLRPSTRPGWREGCGRSSASSFPTGLSVIQSLRTAKRNTPRRLARTPLIVLSASPCSRSPSSSSETSWTVISRSSRAPERREEVVLEVVAVALERALAALARGDPPLVALQPPARRLREPEPWRRGEHSPADRFDVHPALAAGGVELVADRAERQFPAQHEAHRVAAVGLAVDPALHALAPAGAPAATRGHARPRSARPPVPGDAGAASDPAWAAWAARGRADYLTRT